MRVSPECTSIPDSEEFSQLSELILPGCHRGQPTATTPEPACKAYYRDSCTLRTGHRGDGSRGQDNK